MEYLNTLEPSGMPLHKLELKGAVIMLLRNLDVVNGLCDGTRLEVETLGRFVLGCRFICGDHKNQLAIILRIDNYWNSHILFHLRRRQFPVHVAFTITINKSQGLSFIRVGVYLPENVFSMGSYMMPSLGSEHAGLKANTPVKTVKNIVYEEVLR
ncbi:unnamed protein product [Strongylus vulgaris]|uniref:DNA helicase Pif1-like 2B domain-containing protein n=1 Tax=Strongylus vulgaris TaxID=40348 RepID=A0A3P7L8M5_STRVU|nr:unnamed protein product [Strongylus vulgaris]